LIDNVVDEIKAHESTFNFFAMKSEGKAWSTIKSLIKRISFAY
jgi:hypothetical protein